MATEIPDRDCTWYCPNTECQHTLTFNERTGTKRMLNGGMKCPECGDQLTPSVFGLPSGHPARVPYDHPATVTTEVEGIVVGVWWHRQDRYTGYWRMVLDTGGGRLKGTLPSRVRPEYPKELVGARVALTADVTWFEPGKGWYRKPREARITHKEAA